MSQKKLRRRLALAAVFIPYGIIIGALVIVGVRSSVEGKCGG